MTEQQLIERFANAVGHEEDFFVTRKMPTVAQRCNNPGNMDHWKAPDGKPYPEQNGFVVYPDVETGWKSLRSQCRINILKRKLTWLEFFAGKPGVYKGFRPVDRPYLMRDFLDTEKNDPARYAQRVLDRVCTPLGVEMSVRTPVYALLTMMAKGGDVDEKSSHG